MEHEKKLEHFRGDLVILLANGWQLSAFNGRCLPQESSLQAVADWLSGPPTAERWSKSHDKVDNLVKTFGPKRAVDGVSFSVERGEVLGFLGPNGAGKSTSMRMITGFIPRRPHGVCGGAQHDRGPDSAKRLIGYLPENAPAYTDMTVQGF